MTAALLTRGKFTYSFQVLVYLMGSDEPARELAGISMGKQRVNSISRQFGGRSPIAAIKVTKHTTAFPETPLRSRSFTSYSVIFQRRNVGKSFSYIPFVVFKLSAARRVFSSRVWTGPQPSACLRQQEEGSSSLPPTGSTVRHALTCMG